MVIYWVSMMVDSWVALMDMTMVGSRVVMWDVERDLRRVVLTDSLLVE